MKKLVLVNILILVVKVYDFMICMYDFSDGLKYQPYVCNECHDFSMTVINLSDFFILNRIIN